MYNATVHVSEKVNQYLIDNQYVTSRMTVIIVPSVLGRSICYLTLHKMASYILSTFPTVNILTIAENIRQLKRDGTAPLVITPPTVTFQKQIPSVTISRFQNKQLTVQESLIATYVKKWARQVTHLHSWA